MRALQAIIGILGGALLVLGLLFWTGHARSLIPLHMGIGIAFVLAVWIQTLLARRAGAPQGLATVVTFWGFVVAWLGIAQLRLLPGPRHWMIQVVHLLVGVVAMALTGMLSARTPRPRSETSAADRRG